MTSPTPDALAAAHTLRLRRVDDALPALGPLTPTSGATMITASIGDSQAAGLGQTSRVAPEDFASCFQALHQHSLKVRLDGSDLTAALHALLNKWRDVIAGEQQADDETAASITWPSRDTAAVSALVRHGFLPTAAVAIHERPVSTPGDTDPSVRIRRAEPADLDSVVALQLEALRYDEQFGSCTVREPTERTLRARLTAALARHDGTIMLAERGPKAVGLVIVDLPPRTEWITGLVNVSRAGYLECLSVTAEARGTGIGRALVDAAHERFRDAAIETKLLHYCVVNPVSAPFWHGLGYRPLWTHWTARPHSSMFGPSR
ncbi:GNAT family N-acetyltransferase [Phytoactinopolyspora mesophila]|uniref:GNAT family N-acetyltransferase n=1 Tax=Phytoactinopolyspora mesophila TaxID=2650750 RepID=A0A7K3M5C9_9ACTN|nr:GNAT family N-acetyltransferase [Phytoactinopolyspora mesophila]NDL58445.1 GNAT family N-acetyltransferase [Phytoactinopolyspora mesophila]